MTMRLASEYVDTAEKQAATLVAPDGTLAHVLRMEGFDSWPDLARCMRLAPTAIGVELLCRYVERREKS